MTVTALRQPVQDVAKDPFDLWWEAVPQARRKDRVKCQWVYRRIISPEGFRAALEINPGEYVPEVLKATPDQLLTAWIRQTSGREVKVPHPFWWLKEGRFLDG